MKNLAVVMGGYSDESVISLRSGQLILNHLDKTKYHVYEVHILPDSWNVLLNDKKYPINRADFSVTINDQKITFEVIVNTIHGTPGEDGHMQAYWELVNIPYTGCNFYQSSLTFNKRDTLSVLSKFNIPRAKSIYLTEGMTIHVDDVISELGLPFFVKPNQSGSSLGVSMVQNPSEFDKALAFAFAEDKDILLESYLKGTEISVGVLKYKGITTVLGITEIVPKNAFFDYEAKYLGKSDEITPARISVEMDLNYWSLFVYSDRRVNFQGFSRTDFIIMNGIPHFIEINTNPGLSPQSIFPQQAAFAGMNFADLLDNEIKLALDRKPIWEK